MGQLSQSGNGKEIMRAALKLSCADAALPIPMFLSFRKRLPITYELQIPEHLLQFPRATDGARPVQEVGAEISHNVFE